LISVVLGNSPQSAGKRGRHPAERFKKKKKGHEPRAAEEGTRTGRRCKTVGEEKKTCSCLSQERTEAVTPSCCLKRRKLIVEGTEKGMGV